MWEGWKHTWSFKCRLMKVSVIMHVLFMCSVCLLASLSSLGERHLLRLWTHRHRLIELQLRNECGALGNLKATVCLFLFFIKFIQQVNFLLNKVWDQQMSFQLLETNRWMPFFKFDINILSVNTSTNTSITSITITKGFKITWWIFLMVGMMLQCWKTN